MATSLRTTAGFRPGEAGVRGRARRASSRSPGVVASALPELPYLSRCRTRPEAPGDSAELGSGRPESETRFC